MRTIPEMLATVAGDHPENLAVVDGSERVARIPAKNSIKANFHAGGTARQTDLVFRDRKFAKC